MQQIIKISPENADHHTAVPVSAFLPAPLPFSCPVPCSGPTPSHSREAFGALGQRVSLVQLYLIPKASSRLLFSSGRRGASRGGKLGEGSAFPCTAAALRFLGSVGREGGSWSCLRGRFSSKFKSLQLSLGLQLKLAGVSSCEQSERLPCQMMKTRADDVKAPHRCSLDSPQCSWIDQKELKSLCSG